MKKNGWKNLVFGMVLMALLVALAVPAFATTGKKQMEVDYLDIKLVVDGKEVTPKDVNGNVVEPFVYNGTTYLPVRAVGEALGKTVLWDGETKTVYLGEMSQLTVTGTMEKADTTPEKTYGVNTNFVVPGGRMDWTKLPTFNEAVKTSPIATNAKIGAAEPSVSINFKVDGVGTRLYFGYGSEYNLDDSNTPALRVELGYAFGYEDERVLIDAIFQDLLNDSDREQILSKLDEVYKNITVGYTPENGYAAEAIQWRSNFQKSYNLNEVKLQFSDGLAKFAVTTK